MTGPNVAAFGFLVLTIILLGFAGVILWKIARNDIRLEGLISEPPDPDNPNLPAKASLSRFQFLLFSFVIAGLYLLLCIEAGTFLEIPTNVLGLIGISGGSFVLSKGIGMAMANGRATGGDQAQRAAARKAPDRGQ